MTRGVREPRRPLGRTHGHLAAQLQGASEPSVFDAVWALLTPSTAGPLLLAMGWSHAPGELARFPRELGPLLLAAVLSNGSGENAETWPHDPGDWQSR